MDEGRHELERQVTKREEHSLQSLPELAGTDEKRTLPGAKPHNQGN